MSDNEPKHYIVPSNEICRVLHEALLESSEEVDVGFMVDTPPDFMRVIEERFWDLL